ncbi:MAG TPA: hypothetical protein VHZ78_08780 [Rhizomicrobium sp.]|jgi:hypothetical protein|nr:hypothetical protein [Rhizomicrobium sp.]
MSARTPLFSTLAILIVLGCFASAQGATDFGKLGHVTGNGFIATFAGKTADGYTFSIDRDGIGSVRGPGIDDYWTVHCRTDQMTDQRICILDWEFSLFLRFAFTYPAFPAEICVTNTDYMIGRPMMRIDEHLPFEGSPGACFKREQIPQIMNAMHSENRIRVRTNHIANTRIVDVDGRATRAYAIARDLVQFLFYKSDAGILWRRLPAPHHI